ncbi:hypothetical protein PCC9214_05401 (plasmid) [Planktothrix tepida]|uniref:Uncharacterized protein n=1 Tax=Planktothrix tepida PCC 9214 TaxID=671072 RepID=A0A1J1LPF6_9CYAN|nr:hypothetical protein [Planktothrix tepida]CAD5988523.1 hypothetical protein PCC9214_05401 [Planktothrix tepida]CUR33898.1 conserved hypothetical protein [Planktothrix tepida PCC 9214]
MDNPPLEQLNLLDTEYIDILTNSANPNFELELVKKGLDPTEARIKTLFITLAQRKPETPEQWQTFLDAWEQACGYRPTPEHLQLIENLFWNTDPNNNSSQ